MTTFINETSLSDIHVMSNQYYNHNQQPPDRTILNFNEDEYDDENKNNRLKEALLKESRHIDSSERLLDEQFEMAVKTRETLMNQRTMIKSMQTQYNDIASKFPIISNLVNKIQIRKRRDTIILAIIFCICLALLLYTIF